jgi:hypothetical protein
MGGNGMKKDEKKTPVLGDLLGHDLTGYLFVILHYAVLKHGLWGTFPVVLKNNRDDMVMTADPDLLIDVLRLLPCRPYQLLTCPALVQQSTSFAYLLSETGAGGSMLGQERFAALTRERFDALVAQDPEPFEWAPGLVGPGMTRKEFDETLKAALQQHAG